ncbi:hypothetical protein B194_1860 [Serratia plymuthica A30]|nr:hypothetical protein B194_1860 [Serratia plymuthica A30]
MNTSGLRMGRFTRCLNASCGFQIARRLSGCCKHSASF